MAARKRRLYMRPLQGLSSRQEQAFAADFDRYQGKSIQLSQMVRGQCFVRRSDAEAPVPEHQQEMVAVAGGEQEVMQHHDNDRTGVAGFARQTLQHGDLVRQIEMLQGLVEQVYGRPLRE